ncbi:uncharacterized protein MELLADRAFT_59051 [Melampsora larici-populina 98AG31]|uniref:Uncharacterized protein n=1 Tax=Melampsora larici-populina (strain 98AG31 / pathotype 3-4-7) TaxID=747676 RepID=F4R6W1_MELLP|nr:uncharacterized protein MELLADRAFT_59051 [Melampsora larici-populina 98AG31]EGG12387.1 hypothetical protein MELLADRAFT_59051 [Melampsora larici-populina 98AG31]
MAGVEEQIEEDLPSYKVTSTVVDANGPGDGVSTRGHFGNMSKQAFTSTCPPVLGQHNVNKGHRNGSQAKAAFSSTCPPVLDHHRHQDHTHDEGDLIEKKPYELEDSFDAANESSSKDMLDDHEPCQIAFSFTIQARSKDY